LLAFQDIAAAPERWKHAGAAKRGQAASAAAVTEASDEGKHAIAAIEF
jgi:hypothetical protein